MPEARFVTRDQGRHRLQTFVDQRRNHRSDHGDEAAVKHVAGELGVSTSELCRMLRGDAPIPAQAAGRIGLAPVKGYLELE